MKRRIAILISSLALPLAMAGVAHADTTTITNTGPGSNNIYIVTNTYSETVTNVTNTNVSNTNNQSGSTGDAGVLGNTSGGNAVSGDVNNSFNASTAINISNGGPAVGGSGGNPTDIPSNIAGSGSTAESTSAVATLPKTGGDGLSNLMRALLNSRTGVIGPMPSTGVNWSWVPSILALASTIAATYVYSKYKQTGLNLKF